MIDPLELMAPYFSDQPILYLWNKLNKPQKKIAHDEMQNFIAIRSCKKGLNCDIHIFPLDIGWPKLRHQHLPTHD